MNLNPVVVHQIFGALVAAFALALLVHETDLYRYRAADYLPAAALIVLGLLLFADPWLFHGGDFGEEGQQHTLQGLIAVAAGGLEAYRAARAPENRLLGFVLPALLAVFGVAFLQHAQHDGGDGLLQTVQHRIMGATFLLGASVKLAGVLKLGRGNWANAGWLIVLLVIALQMVFYIEGGDIAHGMHHG
jgi:hypothetical protein